MPLPRDRLLSNAGGLLVAAGGIAAFTGGIYGLNTQQPGLILLSVMLLMGYGVVGVLLMNRGAAYFQYVLPSAAVLVVATLILFQAQMAPYFDERTFRFLLEPLLTLLLAYAGGALLTHAIEQATAKYAWPARGVDLLNPTLHVAAYVPIWCAFTLIDQLGRKATPALTVLIVSLSAIAAIACVVGGYAAGRRNHPRYTVIGASAGFAASGAYLYQFMLSGGDRADAAFGQLNALVGLILTGLSIAVAVVAWLQAAHETGDAPTSSD